MKTIEEKSTELNDDLRVDFGKKNSTHKQRMKQATLTKSNYTLERVSKPPTKRVALGKK